MFRKISQSNGVVKPLIVFCLLILGEMSLLISTSINYASAAIIGDSPASQQNVDAGLFDFQIEYLGEVRGKRNSSGNIDCLTGEHTFELKGWDYFIVKMEPGWNTYGYNYFFDFVRFGPGTGNNPKYWSDRTGNKPETCSNTSYWGNPYKTIDVNEGATKANAQLKVRPKSAWGWHGGTFHYTGSGWKIWRVKVNGEGNPAITANAFVLHSGDMSDKGKVDEGCKVSYLMLDDDQAASTGDQRQQKWHVKNMNTGKIVQTVNVPDGMTVGKSFFVRDDLPGTPNLHLILEAQDSIAMLHLENCDEEEFSWQIKMKGVFIATAQREREGVGESGFKFERSINVPPGVAPLLIEYDPKYLIEFAGLLGEALIDWVEIPN